MTSRIGHRRPAAATLMFLVVLGICACEQQSTPPSNSAPRVAVPTQPKSAPVTYPPTVESLVMAIHLDDDDSVASLLQQGVPSDSKLASGEYVLMKAAERGNERITQLLLDHGASVNVSDRRGTTPLSRACLAGRKSVVSLLLHRGAEIKPAKGLQVPLVPAVLSGDMELVQMLLDRGADIQVRDDRQRTVIVQCLTGGLGGPAMTLEMLKFLLDKGVDANAVDSDGHNVLFGIATYREEDVDYALVQELIRRGADPNLADRRGRTALKMATEEEENLPMVKLFESKGQ